MASEVRWTPGALLFAVAHPLRARRHVRAVRAPWPPLPVQPYTADTP